MLKYRHPQRSIVLFDHALSAFKSSLKSQLPGKSFSAHFVVFIDDRLLAQEDCSFDCRCKGTKNLSRKQAFSRRMLEDSV